jgi:general secretion pathway protein I
MMKGHAAADERGFTLIEVIISVAILAVSFVLVMQLFSGGLRASRASCDYSRAIVHARDKMEEMAFSPEQGSGDFEDGFRWESAVEPLESEDDQQRAVLMKIRVKVFWNDATDRDNSIELVSLKAVPAEAM